MGPGAMIYVPGFIKIGSGIQLLMDVGRGDSTAEITMNSILIS
jgi:hypothetical protein